MDQELSNQQWYETSNKLWTIDPQPGVTPKALSSLICPLFSVFGLASVICRLSSHRPDSAMTKPLWYPLHGRLTM